MDRPPPLNAVTLTAGALVSVVVNRYRWVRLDLKVAGPK